MYYSVIWNGKPCNSFKEMRDAVRPGIEAVIKNYSKLHIAGDNKWPIEMIKEIINQKRYKIIKQKTTEGDTALHFAVKHNNKEVCELLLPKMIFNLICSPNNEGKTALDFAEDKELYDLILSYLVKRKI